MADMSTYHSKQTVKARRVEDDEGETVVTANGPQHAAKDDYVVTDENGENTRVMEAELFEEQFKTDSTKTENRRDENDEEEPDTTPAVAQPGNASAKDRVKAQKKADQS